MRRLIKRGNIIDDTWQPIDPDCSVPEHGQICSLEQWQDLADKDGSAVQLEPGQEPTPLFDALEKIDL